MGTKDETPDGVDAEQAQGDAGARGQPPPRAYTRNRPSHPPWGPPLPPPPMYMQWPPPPPPAPRGYVPGMPIPSLKRPFMPRMADEPTVLKGKSVFGKEFKPRVKPTASQPDRSAKRGRRTRWKSRRPKILRYALFTLGAAISITALSIWYHSRAKPVADAKPLAVAAVDTGEEAALIDFAEAGYAAEISTSAERVAWRYVEAIGGLSLWKQTESSIFSGTIESDRGNWEFQLFRRSPNLIKIDIQINDYRISTAFDGSRAWREITQRGDVVNVTEVDQTQEAIMRATSRFLNPLVEYFTQKEGGQDARDGGHLEDLGIREFDGRRLRCLGLDFPARDESWIFYLDPVSYELYASRHQQANGQEITTVYSHYFSAQGRRVPGRETYYFNDSLINTMHIERARFNTGLLSGIFLRSVPDPDAG